MERFIFKKKPLTVTRYLMVILALVFIFHLLLSSRTIVTLFGLVPRLVMKGFVWQLFTFVFLHGGLIHLFWNLLYFWLLGTDVEKGIGTANYIRLLTLCIIGSGIVMCVVGLFSNSFTPIIGSSAIGYGIIGAYIHLFPRTYFFHEKIKVRYILTLLIILSIDQTLIIGHSGALLIGYLYGRLSGRSGSKKEEKQTGVTN